MNNYIKEYKGKKITFNIFSKIASNMITWQGDRNIGKRFGSDMPRYVENGVSLFYNEMRLFFLRFKQWMFAMNDSDFTEEAKVEILEAAKKLDNAMIKFMTIVSMEWE